MTNEMLHSNATNPLAGAPTRLLVAMETAIPALLKIRNYLPPHAVVAAGGENNSRNRAKTRSPCLRKVEMTA